MRRTRVVVIGAGGDGHEGDGGEEQRRDIAANPRRCPRSCTSTTGAVRHCTNATRIEVLATVGRMGTETVPLVHGAGDVTAAWCDVALRDRLDGAHVTAVRTDPVGTGQVADTIRIHLTYDRPGAGPPTLIAKVPSADEVSRAGAAATRHVRDRGQLLPPARR